MLPHLQTWMEENITKQVPELAQVFLDQTVPALVARHVEDMFRLLMVDKITLLVCDELAGALVPKEDGFPAAPDLTGEISTAFSFRVCTISSSETAHAALLWVTHVRAEPVSTPSFADAVGDELGLDTINSHPEGKAIYLPAAHGAKRRTAESINRNSPIRAALWDRKPPGAPQDRK